MDDLPVDDAVDMFYDFVHAAISEHIPVVNLSRKFPPWFDGGVCKALKDKERAFAAKKRSPNDINTTEFREKRKTFKDLAARKYRPYLIGLIGQFRSTPKRFWTFLKSMKMVKTLPAVLRHEGRSATSNDQKTHLLNACFCSKCTQPSDPGEPFPPCHEAAIGTLNSLEVSPFRVSAILSLLDKTKSSSADGLSSMVLLQCADTLAIPLAKIFTKCITSGTYPQKWKEANIIPIHKKERTDLAVNYRAVSLLPVVSKAFEKLLLDAFVFYLFIAHLCGLQTVVWLLPPQCHNTYKHVSDFAICLKETCLTPRKCSNMIMYNVKVDIKAMR